MPLRQHLPEHSVDTAAERGWSDLDVLAHCTPVTSYYKLAKTVEDDPEFDANPEPCDYRISASSRRNPGSTGSADTLSGPSRRSAGAPGRYTNT